MIFLAICGTNCSLSYLQIVISFVNQVNPLHSLKPLPFENKFKNKYYAYCLQNTFRFSEQILIISHNFSACCTPSYLKLISDNIWFEKMVKFSAWRSILSAHAWTPCSPHLLISSIVELSYDFQLINVFQEVYWISENPIAFTALNSVLRR
jgi:hypothetical protein